MTSSVPDELLVNLIPPSGPNGRVANVDLLPADQFSIVNHADWSSRPDNRLPDAEAPVVAILTATALIPDPTAGRGPNPASVNSLDSFAANDSWSLSRAEAGVNAADPAGSSAAEFAAV
ncbi:MAG: hypothetical protein QM572_12735 [Nocardioides sp.]|uniref:hypothetical protein n=1 Tax=Nocardioides sp. TaxID=35761 RepID=UPI0039E3EAF2